MSALITDLSQAVDVHRVGGKAAALADASRAGFPVPDGQVLTTTFFEPWFEELRKTEAWRAMETAVPSDWDAHFEAVRSEALALAVTSEQRAALDAVVAGLDAASFAVRSSSPEEDLGSASFAGHYETQLGVRPDDLLEAVRTCFVSSLTPRVLAYKQRAGLDPFQPRIAVLVQVQLHSDVAGVAFSVDPLTNDYDEVAIDAAPGLGESVVSGAVTPSHYVVDKVDGTIRERTPGAATERVDVAADGGTTRSTAADSPELTDDQLRTLAETVRRLEEHFDTPVDVEWAFVDGTLWVLQSRPITAWVPLPESMTTAPGERRRLYQDLGLSGGLTINAPISPMGQSWMEHFAGALVSTYIGRIPVELGDDDRLWFLEGGRMYQDLSNVLWLSTPRLLAMNLRSTDALVADTLAAVDSKRYRAPKRPSWVSLPMLIAWVGAVWRLRKVMWRGAMALLRPEATRATLDAEVQAHHAHWDAVPDDVTLDWLLDNEVEPTIRHVVECTMPGLMIGIAGLSLLEKLAGDAATASALTRGYRGNVVVEMGLALHALPSDEAEPSLDSPAWTAFVSEFGWRGPHEMDLAAPRYADDPAAAFDQARGMRSDFDPEAALNAAAQARETALDTVLERRSFLTRWLVRWADRWARSFAPTRDTPKHDYLRLFAALRRALERRGDTLVASGRLDDREAIFDLTIADLGRSEDDPDLDLRAIAAGNRPFLDLLDRTVRAFPAIIDSRGRIARPDVQDEPGQLVGTPISPGVARGQARVLHTPEAGRIQPGDILVAHTTDPGWTPLFVDASAVLIEVGGVLQHGAVVAREYGKPCVCGISALLHRVEDGEWLEVDGSTGVVRRIRPRGPDCGARRRAL